MTTSRSQLRRVADMKCKSVNLALNKPVDYLASPAPDFRTNVGHYMVEHSGAGNRYRFVQVSNESGCTRDISETLPLSQLVDVIEAFLRGIEATKE